MAIPLVMSDLSTTPASNSPAGSESPTNGDDFLRATQAILRTTNAKGSDIASATTTDIGAATGEFVDVTGTTTITGLGTIGAGIVRTVRFTGALTLTHNGTSLILPSSANITTAAGDVGQFRSLGSGNWVCTNYMRKDGTAVVLTIPDASITPAKLSTGHPSWDANGVFSGGSASLNISTSGTPEYALIAANTTSSSSNQALAVSRFSADATGSNLVFTKSRGASLGTNTIVQSGDALGRIAFRGADGTNFINAASITATVDGTPGTGDMPTALNFNTTPDGSAAVVERLRISNDGSFSSVIPSGSTLYPDFGCRAWVNFNGTGTPAIRGSGNVSSITDNAVGDWSVNFTTALPDANYSAVATAGNATVSFNRCAVTYGHTTALVKVTGSTGGTGTGVDFDNMHVAVFR
jgi:hypothetical protein